MNLPCAIKPFFHPLCINSLDKRVGVVAIKRTIKDLICGKSVLTLSFLVNCFSFFMPVSASTYMGAEHGQRLTILTSKYIYKRAFESITILPIDFRSLDLQLGQM